jgi:hypothetical protein
MGVLGGGLEQRATIDRGARPGGEPVELRRGAVVLQGVAQVDERGAIGTGSSSVLRDELVGRVDIAIGNRGTRLGGQAAPMSACSLLAASASIPASRKAAARRVASSGLPAAMSDWIRARATENRRCIPSRASSFCGSCASTAP